MVNIQERFWAKVEKDGPDNCWEWKGDKSCQGYGRFAPEPKFKTPDGKLHHVRKMAHRLAWEFTNGPIPDGFEVCHRCDNRPCCNPKHLFLATHRENMLDCKFKGRLNTPMGERQGHSKLTTMAVLAIRAMYIPGVTSMRQLAALFGVSTRTIQFVVERKWWKHVI